MNPEDYLVGDELDEKDREKLSGEERKSTGVSRKDCHNVARWLENIYEEGADIEEAIVRLKTAQKPVETGEEDVSS